MSGRNRRTVVTFSPEDLLLLITLQARLKARSKVDVVRRASRATRASLCQELARLDHLAAEGLDEF